MADLQKKTEGIWMNSIGNEKMKYLSIIFVQLTQFLLAQNPVLVYGPYLQRGGSTSMDVCWRTDLATDSKLKFGTSKFNLNQNVNNGTSELQHRIALGGLNPNTQYFYQVSNSAGTFNTDTFFFYTAPLINSNQKVRILVTGDCGTAMITQQKTKEALMNYIQNKYINCWLLLGDNAYYSGTDAEYTAKFFLPYQNNFVMQKTCLYPATGNHDYGDNAFNAENKTIAYFDHFYLPAGGELGGTASGTEAYYSFNYGNIHFVSIDSYGTENSLRVYDTLSPQYLWLKQDLQMNNSMWTLVYFHHPPFTMGSHNSDLEGELVNMRKYVTPLFEKNKVDLVLSGHSHNYERSWLMKGHQGYELEYNKNIHAKDTSSARYDGSFNSCPYIKDSTGNKGVVYAVCGSAGWIGATQSTYPHNAMYYSNSLKGMAGVIETDGNRLDAKFIGEDSLIHDQFTIFKNIKKNRLIWCQLGQTFTLNASWNGNYNWNYNSNKTKQNLFTVNSNTVIYVRDSLNCFADTFRLQIGTGIEELDEDLEVVFPNPVNDGMLKIRSENDLSHVELFDLNGKAIESLAYHKRNEEIQIRLPELKKGIYFLSIHQRNGTIKIKKLVLN